MQNNAALIKKGLFLLDTDRTLENDQRDKFVAILHKNE
jgi:hypothetical protein